MSNTRDFNEGLGWGYPRYHQEHFKRVTDFGAVGDGVNDDTEAIQAAIDYHAGSGSYAPAFEEFRGFMETVIPELEKQSSTEPTYGGDKHAGVVFFPAGTYRVTDTLLLWKGTHLLCHPENKATLVLPAGTPGFADPDQPKAMIHLTCGTEQDVNDHTHYEAKHGTLNWVFHTALRNLDFIIEEDNQGAVVAWWWADHDVSVEHSHLLLKSGKCAVYMPDPSGRVHLYKCQFEGGEYGFHAGDYSQSSVVACTFRGQSRYAIAIENSAPPTLIKDTVVEGGNAALLANTPGGVIVTDCRFAQPESGYAIDCPEGELLVLNSDFSRCEWAIRDRIAGNPQGQIRLGGYTIGRTYREGEPVEEGEIPYPVDTSGPDYSLADLYADAEAPGNVCKYGAVGDGQQDDSLSIQRAIDENEVVYLPMGLYRLESTVRLKSSTKLIGAHRSATRLQGPDGQAALETPDCSSAQVLIKELEVHTGAEEGIGLDWRCGPDSVIFMVNTWTRPGGYTAFRARGAAGGTYLFGWGGGFQGQNNHGKVFENMTGPMHIYGVDSEHSEYAPYVLRHVANLLMVNWQTESKPRIGASVLCENCRNVRLLGGLAGAATGPLGVRLVNCQEMQLSNIAGIGLENLVEEKRENGEEITVPSDPQGWGYLGFYGWAPEE